MKRFFLMVVCLSLTTTLFAFDVEQAAKEVYKKAGGNKTASQWKRYFRKTRWLKKLGIDKLSADDRARLLVYLNERSAEKDSATVPQF